MKISRQKLILVTSSLLVAGLVHILIYPALICNIRGSHLRDVYNKEAQVLGPTIQTLADGQPSETVFQCNNIAMNHLSVTAQCVRFEVYKYSNQPRPELDRQPVTAQAQKLDTLLVQNGWTADRQQDLVKTVAASVPTTPLEQFHVSSVPFHKNIGNISCNIEISFDGTGDRSVIGLVNVNRFSCQQNITYPMIHIRTKLHNTV